MQTSDEGIVPVTDEEHRLAAEVAAEAGRLLTSVRSLVGASPSVSPRRLGDEGDGRAHQLIVRLLADHFPDDPVLSEEGPAIRPSRRLWVVDPLDGTREYSHRSPDWAVHIALVVDGCPVVGAVDLPDWGITLTTADPPQLGDRPPSDPLRMVVSRSRPPAVAVLVAEHLGAEMVPMGSAGAKVAAVVRGDADVYVHAGGQYEWDSAAPVAVALAAGLHASRLDGSPLRYARPDPWLPDLVVCHPALADEVLGVLREAGPTYDAW